MKQTILTVITKINPVKRIHLEGILKAIRSKLPDNNYVPFAKLTLVHFASFVIVENTAGNPLLVFENNFDGELPDYLDELLSVAGSGIHQIYQCCSDYQDNVYQPQNLKKFLTSNVVRPNAYHIGNVGRKVRDIDNNRQLRIKLQDFIDKLFGKQKPAGISAIQLRKDLQGFAQTLPSNLNSTLPPHQTFAEKLIPWVKVVLAAPFIICLLPGLLAVRWKEIHDEADSAPADINHVDTLMSTENLGAQNHLANITVIKPGLFRLNVLRIVLFAANLLARTSNKGKLSGIPSIHFAHWSIIDNKQLLFLSNFDGSWSSYLDDFIDKASRGLTGIWSNTVGFPKTRFLLLDGATDELRFKAFARSSQVPSQVWYSAYADLTVQNIDKDSAIRENVLTNLSEADTKQWLKLF